MHFISETRLGMKSLKMNALHTSNTRVEPTECPIHRTFCYESLGVYSRQCSYHKGFYCDTGSVECCFDEEKPENKELIYNLALKLKGTRDW